MKSNIGLRRLAATTAAMVLGTVALMLVPAGSAHATINDCDATGVIGRFRKVDSGASFTFRGRVVELQNESALDRYSRAEIKSGRQPGDRLWIDRSKGKYLDFKGVVSHASVKENGWKMCGPFIPETRTQSVYNANYAARACAEIDGLLQCGKWYVD